jgi:hypothetical protein
MARLLIPVVLAFGVIAIVFWIFESLGSAAKSAAERAKQQKLENKRHKEQKKLEYARRREEAVATVRETAPQLAVLRDAVATLHHFVASADAYRPKLTLPFDTKFREVRFSFPFEAFFPRDCRGSTDGPDPEPWVTTPDNLLVPKAHDLRSIYAKCMDTNTFPCSAPIVSFDPPSPPQHPRVELPLSALKIVADADKKSGLRRLFTLKISQDWKLQEAADELRDELAELGRKAEEARDLMEIHVANEQLACREAQNSLTTEFNHWKRNYEQESEEQLAPIKTVLEDYVAQTSASIERHFQLALRTLLIPVPSTFPWSTFYDSNERLLQVNQRVPSLSDIVLKRADSKRPPAKKDADNFLRRVVPAVSLHIAQHVALNDFYENVDTIAVNCWCRYFERTTGQLKNAFVSSLSVEKKDILQIDINRADPLDAFRALRGAYVYSTEETVPIEPQIRLDKKDDRFVAGKEVLEGMAQGQNLATMDWQDFEHLIRELLARAARASRAAGRARTARQACAR